MNGRISNVLTPKSYFTVFFLKNGFLPGASFLFFLFFDFIIISKIFSLYDSTKYKSSCCCVPLNEKARIGQKTGPALNEMIAAEAPQQRCFSLTQYKEPPCEH